MSATNQPKQFIAARAYEYEGIALNVYATHEEDGWQMSSVTLVGSDVDLFPLLSDAQIGHFDALVERRYLEYCEDENANARIERALSHRQAVVDLMYGSVFPAFR